MKREAFQAKTNFSGVPFRHARTAFKVGVL
jgi:hypothetical protein